MNPFPRLLNFLNKKIYRQETYLRKKGIKIGHNCRLGRADFGGEPFLISIGNNVQITDDVHFYTHGGGWVLRKEIPDLDFFGKINIKDNVYIGSGACIMPGVTIESNVIIAAKAVVTKSVPEGVIVGGNPAKIIGTINDFKTRVSPFNLKTKGLTYKEKVERILNSPDEMFIKKGYLK